MTSQIEVAIRTKPVTRFFLCFLDEDKSFFMEKLALFS